MNTLTNPVRIAGDGTGGFRGVTIVTVSEDTVGAGLGVLSERFGR